MALKVTLDTNCFFEYFERDPTHIEKLIDLSSNGYIELAMTTRVMTDTHDKWKGQGPSPIWQNIKSFGQIKTIGTAFRIDHSRLDSGDYIVSEDDVTANNRIQEIMSDAQVEDVDHLFGHIKDGRDIFITSDKHFLDHKEELGNEFKVIILKPEDAVMKIQEMII